MVGWDDKESGPAGVMRQIEQSSRKMNLSNISFVSFSKNKFYAMKLIFEKIKKNDGTVFCVHSGPYLLCTYIMLLSNFFRKNKYYLVVHGVFGEECKYITSYRKYPIILEKILYRKFSNIICVSEFCKNEIKRIYNRIKNIYVINNGYLVNDVSIVEKETIDSVHLIMIGGIRKRKGVFETVELVEYLNSKFNIPVFLDIYGSFFQSDLEQYQTMVVDSKNVSFHGLIDDKKELLSILSKYDIHIALSYYDTFNVAIPEALSVGVPTITTVTCGASVYVENYSNGLVVDLKQDYKYEIFKYIKEYIDNKEFRTSNRNNSKKSVSNCNWDQVTKEYYKLLTSKE